MKKMSSGEDKTKKLIKTYYFVTFTSLLGLAPMVGTVQAGSPVQRLLREVRFVCEAPGQKWLLGSAFPFGPG